MSRFWYSKNGFPGFTAQKLILQFWDCQAARQSLAPQPLAAAQSRFLTGKKWKEGLRITTEYLLNREVEHVLSALMPQNRLICRVILQTGLRISDVLCLKPEQLKLQFWIHEQKTGKARRVNLTQPLLDELCAHSGKYWVFPGRNPRKHKTRQAVWADIKRAAAAFRLPVNAAPHSLRKVYAVELMRKYGSLRRVQRALNHDSATVTMIYAMADHILESRKKVR